MAQISTGSELIAVLAAMGAMLAAGGVFWQARLSRHAVESEVLMKVYEILQDESRRHLRRRFYREIEPKTFLEEPPPFTQEEKDLIDEVAHPYQLIALMVTHHFIGASRIEHWKHSINRVWRVAQPIVEERRRREGNADLMQEFEFLAGYCRRCDPQFPHWLEERKREALNRIVR